MDAAERTLRLGLLRREVRQRRLESVEPVVVRPLLAEWERDRAAIAAELKRAEAGPPRRAQVVRGRAFDHRGRRLGSGHRSRRAAERPRTPASSLGCSADFLGPRPVIFPEAERIGVHLSDALAEVIHRWLMKGCSGSF